MTQCYWQKQWWNGWDNKKLYCFKQMGIDIQFKITNIQEYKGNVESKFSSLCFAQRDKHVQMKKRN